ncbi:MAG TPA: MFS transporter [Terriglobales bacterium]|nr:MFS transporter [Terriglobales bacterium]
MSAQKDDPKTVFAWCMYDWANSAYITTIVGLMPVYFANVVVGEKGVTLSGTHYHPDSLWGLMVGFADALAFLAAPVLGAIADFTAAKRRFLLSFAYTGAIFAMLLYFCRSGEVYRTMLFFVVAQFAFVSANVFYDAFLPQIASDERMDWVSGKGYSYGYVGGGLQFALALVLVTFHARFGLTQEAAARIGLGSAGLWWAGFTLFTARGLREGGASEPMPPGYEHTPRVLALVHIGVSRTLRTLRKVGNFRHLVLFLVAFMLYNDGIQTVINLATAYGTVELHLSPSVLMGTLLLIQFIGVGGALLFGKLAQWMGTKPAIMLSLVLWSGVVIYAYFMQTATQFVVLGVIVGMILGGSQALSRSYFGSMVPEEASAEFYGFYTVFTKFASIWGPLAFAIIKQVTGSSRLAIVSLIFFFVVGLTLLHFVDDEKARAARTAGAF